MILRRYVAALIFAAATVVMTGCTLVPDTQFREAIHNPFPQLKRVAVLPFFNQSNDPTLDTTEVAEAYYAALQAIPGFEVLPTGVTRIQWMRYAAAYGEPSSGEDFQRLAQLMGVEAVVVGSVTDYQAFYPPRMAMTVHWYAANEGFHPIPAGYGLPWGTENEKQIPRRIAREAEFELARSQLATQTPLAIKETQPPAQPITSPPAEQVLQQTGGESPLPVVAANDLTNEAVGVANPEIDPQDGPISDLVYQNPLDDSMLLPANWPDPTDLIPDPPAPARPEPIVNHEPVLSHTRLYRGDDSYFTNRLSDYVNTGDDARPGGWQGYLRRSDDFVRFCCHLHITEMLESRGGSDQGDLILRWPFSRN